VIVDEELECKVKAVLQLINISSTSAQRRHDELQSALKTVETMERDLRENIELLKSIRDRISSSCVLSADVSQMKSVRDELLVVSYLVLPLTFLCVVCGSVLIHVS